MKRLFKTIFLIKENVKPFKPRFLTVGTELKLNQTV